MNQGLLGSAEKLKALGVPAKKDQKFPERFTAPEFSSAPLSVRLIGEDADAESEPDARTDDAPALSDGLELPLSGDNDALDDADAAETNDQP